MGRGSSISREEAESLRIEDVQRHLQLDGWTRDAGASSATASLYRKGGQELVLPATRDVVDYAARMSDVVRAVAEMGSRSPRTVFATLSRPPSTDVIRPREVSPLTTQGYIPLRDGVRLIGGGSAGLLAAAHSACDPIAFHPRLGVQRATDLIDRCRLGTDRGSFVAVILVPAPAAIQLAIASPGSHDDIEHDDIEHDDIEDEPFPRQVTRLFMSALGTVRSAMDANEPERLLNAADRGVSGNLCDAVSDMLPDIDQSHVEVTADWARTRRPAPPTTPSAVTFRAGEQAMLRSASNQLREQRTPEAMELAGTIGHLSGDTTGLFGDRAGQFNGRVRMQTTLFDQQVQLRLGAADYQRAIEQRAIEAHATGASVRVVGIVRRHGQTIELQNPTNFRLA